MMQPKLRLILWVTLWCLFFGYSIGIVVTDGVGGIAALFEGNPWKAQVFFDLCIMLGLFLGWMWKDAREQGIPALPYLLLGAFTGSVGALAYLIHRAAKQVTAGQAAKRG